ncbi:serine/threonine protein kinase [Bacillus inaquosorum]|uniref:serine/threonine protein kinase n=1 Tax=Bacillus inaquosorum TaxID=483913 RepID=UPI003F186508
MSDYQEMKAEQSELWRKLAEDIFKEKVNNVQTFKNLNEIVYILSRVGQSTAHNYTFTPSGGGNELADASLSLEQGRLELKFDGNSVEIIEPVSLTFNPIGSNPDWWYYRINTKSFDPSGVYKKINIDVNENNSTEAYKSAEDKEQERLLSLYGEPVLEIAPKEYIDISYQEQGYLDYDEDGNEIPLPANARIIQRRHNGGDFVIFPKFSPYSTHTEFDGGHSKVKDEEFRSFISAIVAKLEK